SMSDQDESPRTRNCTRLLYMPMSTTAMTTRIARKMMPIMSGSPWGLLSCRNLYSEINGTLAQGRRRSKRLAQGVIAIRDFALPILIRRHPERSRSSGGAKGLAQGIPRPAGASAGLRDDPSDMATGSYMQNPAHCQPRPLVVRFQCSPQRLPQEPHSPRSFVMRPSRFLVPVFLL